MPRSGRVPRPPPAPGASTPAHTGPASWRRPCTATTTLYPRARGADLVRVSDALATFPLPPRTRGRLHLEVVGGLGQASTPAHAGPARRPPADLARPSLYPRARGASTPRPRTMTTPSPLPPRTRGQLRGQAADHVRGPSTPAHAGPAGSCSAWAPPACLYPRARGASLRMLMPRLTMVPLPPRTRGQRDPVGVGPPVGASTPAHAGPADRVGAPPGSWALYPRARGASSSDTVWRELSRPLPPRTRGQPRRSSASSSGRTSTPAHAGPALEYR